jgi:predicted DNA-binding transcriptional regulator AlpA
MNATKQKEPVESMLINANTLAALLGVSRAKLFRMKAAGQLPKPIRLGGSCVKWRRVEVIDWIESGCNPGPSI